MQIFLSPEMERLIHEKVRSGDYESESQVVEAALRLLEAEEEDLAALRSQIQVGLDEIRRGEGLRGDEAFAAIRAEVRRRTGR